MASVKFLLGIVMLAVVTCPAQTTPPSDPATTQIRKAVTFIKLQCTDGGRDFDVRGTGFFVFYPDPRLGAGGFDYLVTNRHVAECWNDAGHPMQVKSISLTMNLREAHGDSLVQEVLLTDHGNLPWILPEDGSVDLAAFPVLFDQTRFDYKTVPTTMFASSDFLKEHRIVEGETVLFAGFFTNSQALSGWSP
jgi:hypothetical protein